MARVGTAAWYCMGAIKLVLATIKLSAFTHRKSPTQAG
jgi:hypothetical protein